MSSPLDLSVVIVTHNVGHLIGDCLHSLAQECVSVRHEVIVVDSGSTDDTTKVIRDRFPEVRLRLSRENVGFAPANNLALPECRGRYILLLNPDTVVHPGALHSLMRYLDEHPGVGAVGPTLRLSNGAIQSECARNLPKVSNLFPWLLLLDKAEWKLRFRGGARKSITQPPRGTILDRFSLLSWGRDQSCAVECICGACMMIRTEIVQRVGLLDETSPLYLDDIDYCRRISEAGWTIHYVAGPTVTHLWKQSSSQSKRDGDFYAMGCHAIWLYLRKHDGVLAGMAFSAMAGVASLLRVLVCLMAMLVPARAWREIWRKHLDMALGLGRWALRWPKAAPQLGFRSKSTAITNVERSLLRNNS